MLVILSSGSGALKTNEGREGGGAGVVFTIKSHRVNKLSAPTKGISDRLMKVLLPLIGRQFATLTSVYAPATTNSSDIKEAFCKELKATVAAVPRVDKLIQCCDFNARVDTEHTSCKGVLGRNGIGKCNSNGHSLL